MKFKVLIRMMLVTLVVTSCGKDPAPEPEPTPGPGPSGGGITLTETELVLPESGEPGSFSFTTAADWTVTLSETKAVQDWLSVEPMSGKAGSASLTVMARPNETYEDRSALITLKAGADSKSLTVYQKKKNALILSKEVFEVSENGGRIDLEVKSNVDFDVVLPDDWITQFQTKALTTHRLLFDVAPNPKEGNREGRIVIKSKSSDLADTVRVFQIRENSLVLSQREYSVSEEGEMIDVVLKSNVDFTVQMPDVDWIEEVQTKSLQTYKCQYRILPNETYEGREAQIVFKDNRSDLADTVFVYQTTKDALLLSRDHYELEATGGNIDVEVKSNVDFEVKISNDWITQIQPQKPTTHRLKFAITENPDSERTGHIVFKDRNSSLSDTVYIIQDGCADGIAQDREALIALYNATGGDNWKQKDNWCSDRPLNEWYGVQVDGLGRVMYLMMHENNMQGALPAEIGNLSELQILKLENMGITSVPAEIGRLSKLDILGLSLNQIAKLPEEIGDLPCLTALFVNENRLTVLPEAIGRLESLIYLDFSGNALTGAWPGWIGKLTRLKYLSGHRTGFAGPLPAEWAALRELEELGLTQSGGIPVLPAWLGDLPQLRQLLLAQNGIEGSVTELVNLNLPLLTYLELSYNHLTGSLPNELSRLMDRASGILLQGNRLSGTIPREMLEHPQWIEFVGSIVRQQEGYGFERPEHIGILPAFTITDINGTTLDSRTLFAANRLTIVSCWASWCPFSLLFQPELKNLRNEFASQGLGVVSVNRFDDNASEVLDYISQQGMNWTNVLVPSTYPPILPATEHFPFVSAIYSVPAVHVVDAAGKILFSSSLWDELGDLRGFIAGKLGGSQPAYVSTDFSADGQVVTLQRASVGSGIDLVLMGDAFVDTTMIAGGIYEQHMREGMEAFFAEEPLKSLRDRFNVYAVKAVSKYGYYADQTETALQGYFGTGTHVGGTDSRGFDYARRVPDIDLTRAQVVVIMNDRRHAGTCYMYYDNSSIAYFPLGYDQAHFCELLNHEAVGHGFGKLKDEYWSNSERIPDTEISDYQYGKSLGWGANADVTQDPNAIRWAHFLRDSRYSAEVGIWEGALTYRYGAWRPTENSIMNDAPSGFNAPSREALYKRIMELSGEGYTWERFVEYDALNRSAAAVRARAQKRTIRDKRTPLHAPVIIRGTWRDAQ